MAAIAIGAKDTERDCFDELHRSPKGLVMWKWLVAVSATALAIISACLAYIAQLRSRATKLEQDSKTKDLDISRLVKSAQKREARDKAEKERQAKVMQRIKEIDYSTNADELHEPSIDEAKRMLKQGEEFEIMIEQKLEEEHKK